MHGRDSFEEYVAARRGSLLRTAYLLTGSHADAEDLVQVVLIKIVPKWRRIADDPDAYIRTTLARESITRWRRRRWREVYTDRVPETIVGEPVDERMALRQALVLLAPRQRAVLVLRYFEDRTERETADILGIAVGTVKSQSRDALARLRTLVPELDGDVDSSVR